MRGRLNIFCSICLFMFTYFPAPVHFLPLSAFFSPSLFIIINLSVLSLSRSRSLSIYISLSECHLNSFIFLLSCDEVRYWKMSIMLFGPLQENIPLNINLNTNTITNPDSAWDGFCQQPKCDTHTHTHTHGACLKFKIIVVPISQSHNVWLWRMLCAGSAASNWADIKIN